MLKENIFLIAAWDSNFQTSCVWIKSIAGQQPENANYSSRQPLPLQHQSRAISRDMLAPGQRAGLKRAPIPRAEPAPAARSALCRRCWRPCVPGVGVVPPAPALQEHHRAPWQLGWHLLALSLWCLFLTLHHHQKNRALALAKQHQDRLAPKPKNIFPWEIWSGLLPAPCTAEQQHDSLWAAPSAHLSPPSACLCSLRRGAAAPKGPGLHQLFLQVMHTEQSAETTYVSNLKQSILF